MKRNNSKFKIQNTFIIEIKMDGHTGKYERFFKSYKIEGKASVEDRTKICLYS